MLHCWPNYITCKHFHNVYTLTNYLLKIIHRIKYMLWIKASAKWKCKVSTMLAFHDEHNILVGREENAFKMFFFFFPPKQVWLMIALMQEDVVYITVWIYNQFVYEWCIGIHWYTFTFTQWGQSDMMWDLVFNIMYCRYKCKVTDWNAWPLNVLLKAQSVFSNPREPVWLSLFERESLGNVALSHWWETNP